jgi:hypothetical protein
MFLTLAYAESLATPKSSGCSIFWLAVSRRAVPTGKTASRKTPRRCAWEASAKSPTYLRALLLQQKGKPLSFREKKMLDRARHMLLTEVSTSRGLSMDQAVEILQKSLGKCNLNMPEPL